VYRRSSRDSVLEAFRHNPTDGSFAALAAQPTALPNIRTKVPLDVVGIAKDFDRFGPLWWIRLHCHGCGGVGYYRFSRQN
jgi:hypothetical protein